jgi:hypothetical protein
VARFGKALLTAARETDYGTEARHLELLGNGFNGLNRQSEALPFPPRRISALTIPLERSGPNM